MDFVADFTELVVVCRSAIALIINRLLREVRSLRNKLKEVSQ